MNEPQQSDGSNSLRMLSTPLTLPLKILAISASVTVAIFGAVVAVQEHGFSWWLLIYPFLLVILYGLLWPMFCIRRVAMEAEGIQVRGITRVENISYHNIDSGYYCLGRGCTFVVLNISDESNSAATIAFMPRMGIDPLKNPAIQTLQLKAGFSLTKTVSFRMAWISLWPPKATTNNINSKSSR